MDRVKINWKLREIYLKNIQIKNLYCLYTSVRHLKKKYNHFSVDVKHYITKLVNPSAGIGDQLASIITGLFYADLYHLDYAYTSLYPNDWNEFLGLSDHAVWAEELIKLKGYKKVRLPFFEHKNKKEKDFINSIIESYKGEKIVFFIENNHIYGEQYEVRHILQNKFYLAKAREKDKLIYSADSLNIAVHVRRGDISDGGSESKEEYIGRWLENRYYIEILTQLVYILKSNITRVINIYLFSQGRLEDFKDYFEIPHINYCLSMNAQQSFLHMIKADILVTSKSSFSYKPALISKGLKVCPMHFWHSYPMEESDWILVNEENTKFTEEMKEKCIRFFSRY